MSCVVIYQIHNIAGYSNSIYSPFVDAAIKSKGQVEYHKIHKRQADTRSCYGTILPQLCTNGLAQELADLALQCGESYDAHDLFNKCQRNPMGVYCGDIAIDREIINDISAACRGSNCTSQCRNLLINIRNELGCCINIIFNGSSYSHYFAFSYSLWASCEVEPVPNDCTSSTLIRRPISIDPSCTIFSYEVNIVSLYCSARYIEPILETLANENNCGNFSQSISEYCEVNEAGVPCYEVINATSIYYGNARSVCATTTTATTSCSEDCRAGLQDLKSSAGCCINYIHNDSGINDPILTYEFWRRCGVATPGICEIQFNSATTNTALSKLALILFPILMAAYF